MPATGSRSRSSSSAADRAYAYAKERILDGRFAGGELITEGDVAAGVAVSRTPVREAFLRLEADGFLRLYPKRGALVVPISVAEVNHVMETRLLVERHAVARAIETRADLGPALEKLLAKQERLAARGETRAFVEADREFHRVLVEAAENPILLQLHDSLRERQGQMGLRAIASDDERTREILAEHRALRDAVLAGDAARAHGVLERHLAGTLRLLQGRPLAPAP